MDRTTDFLRWYGSAEVKSIRLNRGISTFN